MKKKDIIKGTVTRTEFPNIGIIETDSGDVRIKNALLGSVLEVQIQKVRKGKYEGRITEVITPSPYETAEDICPHFGICGGCLYSSIPYEKELEIKETQIKTLLSKAMGPDTFSSVYRGITGSPKDTAYRNKMEFSFGDEYKGGPLALGMHKRGAFYDIVTVSDCHIVSDDYHKILLTTLDFFKKRNIPFFNKNTHTGYLRHLLVRQTGFTGQILIDLVTASGMDWEVLEDYKESLLTLKEPDAKTGKPALKSDIAGILHTKNDRISDVVEDQGTTILYGKDFFEESLLSLSFKITPFSFFQTNSYGAEVLYTKVKDLVPKTGIIYDLYCGTGTIGQIVSDVAEHVVGVEIVEEAVKAARENADKNKIDNTEFIAGDVLKTLDDIEKKPDMIILDPPREGVNPKALRKILDYGVEEIIYVSCKPTSLARDYGMFMESGYKAVFVECVDMFPRTANVETICKFKKGDE